MSNTGQSFWRGTAGRTLRMWLPLAAALTILCGVVYLVAQQQLRLGADDPQIALAEDAAAALRAGQAVAAVVPATPVDIAASVAPYLIVFDDAGQPLAASARLNGSIPTVPA